MDFKTEKKKVQEEIDVDLDEITAEDLGETVYDPENDIISDDGGLFDFDDDL